jgi:RNA polymerase sigma factor (sigma-70 family)
MSNAGALIRSQVVPWGRGTEMRLGASRRRLMSSVRCGTADGAKSMGMHRRSEASPGSVPGSNVIAEEAIWFGTLIDGQLDIPAEGETLRGEWTQPRLSDDAYERIMALYDEYRPRLYRYLRTLGMGRDWADEVIQEAFMRLTVKLLANDDIKNVRAWVIRVAHNLAMDVLKKERGEITSDETTAFLIENRADPSLNPEEAYSRSEQSIQMELALSTLKPQHRQCFQMRAHGFRYKDIGVALGISEQRAAFVVKQAAVQLAAICG